MAYEVTAPLVIVRVGNKNMHLYKGDTVPSTAAEADITRLVRRGLIADPEAAPRKARKTRSKSTSDSNPHGSMPEGGTSGGGGAGSDPAKPAGAGA